MRLITLNYTHMGIETPVSHDYVLSSFLSIFTQCKNKCYENAARYQCHMTKQKLYLDISNATQINNIKF